MLFDGGQLTAERACSGQRAKSNSDNAKERLEGLVPVVEDLHSKVGLLKVCFKLHELIFELIV